VVCGDFSKKVAEHGYSRRCWITSVNVDDMKIDGKRHGTRHWHCRVWVSYQGVEFGVPEEGAHGPVPEPPLAMKSADLQTLMHDYAASHGLFMDD
jgi:hypothetical protein